MKISPLRRYTDKALFSLTFSGRVLDIGGSREASYHQALGGASSVTVVNIDPKTNPDVIHDVEKIPLPFSDHSFDTILLVNLLEHVYHFDALIRECRRVVKKEGRVVLVVPFLYYIHESPHDYFRYTKEALETLLASAGFTESEVRELGVGAFLAAYNIMHRFFPSFAQPLLTRACVLMDRIVVFTARILGKKYNGSEYPLGYVVVAHP